MSDIFKSLTAAALVLAGVAGCHSPGTVPDVGYSTVRPPLVHPEPASQSVEKSSASPGPLALAAHEEPAVENCAPGIPCAGDFEPISPRQIFERDREDFFPMLARDTRGLANWRDLALLGGSLGGSIVAREELDDEVRDYVRGHPERWDKGSETLGLLGEVQYQVPVILGVYGYSVYSSNDELRDLSKAIISAYTITGLSTVLVKGIADTERPSREWNDGKFGFPSYHTASSFSIAAVVEEYEGVPTALPIYALAGLIGWSRIDERDHDLSDVLFGAALGYVIGKSVAKQHRERDSEWRLLPYSHPVEPAAGLGAEVRF